MPNLIEEKKSTDKLSCNYNQHPSRTFKCNYNRHQIGLTVLDKSQRKRLYQLNNNRFQNILFKQLKKPLYKVGNSSENYKFIFQNEIHAIHNILTVSDDVKTFVQADLWVLYVQCREFLQQFQKSHNEILYNGSLKKFRFACQKAVITPVNAINAISREHLTDKYNRVVSFLTGKSNPKVDMHPQGFSFCIYMLAKKIVVRLFS